MEDLFPSFTPEAQEAAWTQPQRTAPRSTARSLYAAFEEASTFPDESDFRALDRLDTMAEEGLTTPRDLRDGYSPSLGALNSDDDSYLDSPAASDYDDASMGSAPPLHPVPVCLSGRWRNGARSKIPIIGANDVIALARPPFGFAYYLTARPVFVWPFRRG